MESRVDKAMVEKYRQQMDDQQREAMERRAERKADDVDRGTFHLRDADGNLIPHKSD